MVYATRPFGEGDSLDKRILRGRTEKGRRTVLHIDQSAYFRSFDHTNLPLPTKLRWPPYTVATPLR